MKIFKAIGWVIRSPFRAVRSTAALLRDLFTITITILVVLAIACMLSESARTYFRELVSRIFG